MGPTAVGKSSLALLLAERYNLEIFSSDSRQVFKELTIGTAKPSKDELSRVKHHFINTQSIHENYSAGHYEKDVLAALDAYFKSKNCAILVGGTGLYIDAILTGLDQFPDIPLKIQQQVEFDLKEKGLEYLIHELEEKDSTHAKKIDLKNPRRVVRAIMVIRTSGQSYSSFLNQEKAVRNFIPINLILKLERKDLYERINRRVDQMRSKGLLEEAKGLIEYRNLRALQTVGYQEAFSYLDGSISLKAYLEEIKKNSRRYAKRQITWLKKYDCPSFLPTEINAIVKHIEDQLKQNS